MPLIECPDCGKQVSDQAPACPNCGRPMHGPGAASGRVRVEDENAKEIMGKPGTVSHSLNVGCLALIVGVILAILLIASGGI